MKRLKKWDCYPLLSFLDNLNFCALMKITMCLKGGGGVTISKMFTISPVGIGIGGKMLKK